MTWLDFPGGLCYNATIKKGEFSNYEKNQNR
jgi:hypothetical protein